MVMPTPAGKGCDPARDGEERTRGPIVLMDSLTNPPSAPNQPTDFGLQGSMYIPGWHSPPRVLVVDDDVVCRKLSSKFLQIFGCSSDIAVDGVGAVNKMNIGKYDLVLMVSPNSSNTSSFN